MEARHGCLQRHVRGRFAASFRLGLGAAACAVLLVAGAPETCPAADHEAELAKAVADGDVLVALDALEALMAMAISGQQAAGNAGQSELMRIRGAIMRAFEAKSAWIRRGSLRALGVLGGEGIDNIILRALADEDAVVRLDACGVAARAALPAEMLPRIAEALSSRLGDERQGVRAEAARALGVLVERLARARGNVSLPSGVVEALKVAALGDREPSVRAAALEALARAGGETGFQTALNALTEDEDERVREAATRALVLSGGEQAIEHLEHAAKDPSGLVRTAAARALGAIGSDLAVASLVRILALRDEDLRSEATSAIGRIGTARARDALRALLSHSSGEVRREAAQALGQLADAPAIEPLARLIHDVRADVRAAAVEALGRLVDVRAAAAVRSKLFDTDAEVRARAAEATARLGDLAAVPRLLELLGPEFSDGERVAAATALGFLGDLRAARPLVALLDDNSEHVRRASASALAYLGTNGEALLQREAAFKGGARVEFLGALALLRVGEAEFLFRQELKRQTDERARFACEVGLYMLGDTTERQAVLDGSRGARPGANPALALAALALAGDPEAEPSVHRALASREPGLRESAALALGVARPSWGEALLREIAAGGGTAAFRAKVALRWLEIRGTRK